MIFSFNKLKEYFDGDMPSAEEIAQKLNFQAFEVECMEKVNKDTIIDLDILPDRACYALSHRGIAREIASGFNLKLKDDNFEKVLPNSKREISITIEDSDLCPRYIGRVIDNVEIKESTEKEKEFLNSLEQRSVNNIVDILNVLMFEIGQPMHAFDADKVKGGIVVRLAKVGEKMATLDDKTLILSSDMLVIADDEGPIALAGVKGGKRAEVMGGTKRIILESASFNSTSVRRTSSALNLRTDASKRFENKVTPHLAEEAMERATKMILDAISGSSAGYICDNYPDPEDKREVKVDPEFISSVLGVDISTEEIVAILENLRLNVENLSNKLSITIPYERYDLYTPEDIVEEVGRIYGYEKVEGQIPFDKKNPDKVNKEFYYSEKIKDFLVNKGFSEVYLYTFRSEGDIEVKKSMASDKNFLRVDLSSGIGECLIFNNRYADLLGLDQIKIFEIGKVFRSDGIESLNFSCGIKNSKKKKNKEVEELKGVIYELNKELGVDIKTEFKEGEYGALFDVDLEEVLNKFPTPQNYDNLELSYRRSDVKVKKVSPYPFVLRDIAVFIPENSSKEDLLDIIKKESRELLVNTKLFDIFEKEFEDGKKKTSYAYRLVFQSFEKTLSDEEVNEIMDRIEKVMNSKKGWEVR